ncbi:unnamed protein product, partial [marine sediment metagenome]
FFFDKSTNTLSVRKSFLKLFFLEDLTLNPAVNFDNGFLSLNRVEITHTKQETEVR